MGLTIAQISDTHLVRTVDERPAPASPDACLERTIGALLPARPDLVLLTGDLSDDGSLEACERVRRQAERLGAPILATGGNHDDADVIEEVFGSERSAALGAWQVEVVDTSVAGQIAGAVDPAAALARLDASATGERPTIVALHHLPATAGTHHWFVLDGADELVAGLTQRPQVRAVISGHLHQSFELGAGHVRYVGAPSTWYALAHTGPRYELDPSGPTGAVLFDLGDDATFTWRLVGGPAGDAASDDGST